MSLPNADRLHELIDAMAGRPVVLLVDLVADRFITGMPKRISREAPVLILRWEGESYAPGGGANAVANVAALGGHPLPLGVLGDDEHGRRLRSLLEERRVDTSGIVTRPGYRTPTKTRVLAGARGAIKQQMVRYDIEDWLGLEAAERQHFARRLDAWGGDDEAPGVAVLSDYGYGTVEPALVAQLAARLGPEAHILCDSRYRLDDFEGLDGATPNQEEAEALLGERLPDTPEELAAVGQRLRWRLGVRFLLLTRGSAGMSLISTEGSTHLPVHGTAQVADVTGAGDTVIGTFALALAAGATPVEAALLADYAGGVVVMKMGTATLSREELRAAVCSDPAPRDGAVRVEA